MARTPLDADRVQELMRDVPAWRLENGRLTRSLEFPDFPRAFGFMSSVALVAQQLDHHPDWTNAYNRLRIELHTHDAGGLTRLDFELARRIDALAAPVPES